MQNLIPIRWISFLTLIHCLFVTCTGRQNNEALIVSYTVDPAGQHLAFYWKDENGRILKSLQQLKAFVEQKNLKLNFAMNGGMFNADYSPKGLYIENNILLSPLDTGKGEGNFYLQPNGVFYITNDKTAIISKTEDYIERTDVRFATQSGPMLLIEGQINKEFRPGSSNRFIRNGVGILPNNKIIFALSKQEINLYDFAEFFKAKGCVSALYLDGFVSRAYIPDKNWKQLDGDFGVMIGVTEPIK